MKVPERYREMEYRDLLVMLAKMFHPKVYVEIGIKNCYTFNAMLPYVEKAYGVDIRKSTPDSNYTNWSFHRMFSKEFADMWRSGAKGQIDFLFIDADHRKDSVLEDFTSLARFVSDETGLVFLHDTYPIKEELLQDGYCSNAWEAAKEIRSISGWFESVTLPGPWAGLTIIRKLANGRHGWMEAYTEFYEGEKK